MSFLIGKKLKQARLRQGLTTEDVAHETRIPESSLRHLEEDDFSGFANPTYARGFLSIYAEHLGVDASEMLEAMSGPKSKAAEADYLTPKIKPAPPNTTIPIYKNYTEQRRGHPVLMMLAIILLVFLIPTVYFIAKHRAYNEMDTAAGAPPPAAAEPPEPATPVTPPEIVEAGAPEPAQNPDQATADSDRLKRFLGLEVPLEGRAEITRPTSPPEFEIDPPAAPGEPLRAVPVESPGEGRPAPENFQPTAAQPNRAAPGAIQKTQPPSTPASSGPLVQRSRG